MATVPQVKACRKCGETKSSASFWRDRWRADGLYDRCKQCCGVRGLPPLTAEERFRSKVNKDGPVHPVLGTACWMWTGGCRKAGRHSLGYGVFSADGHQHESHRFAWALERGPIPDGLCVCHHCDNPRCVRPDHLFLGTHDDNLADMIAKGRHARGDRSGSRRHPERYPRGERHPRAAVSDATVREIRARYAAGGVTQRSLAVEFGISPNAVHYVIRRKTWQHV